MRSLRKFIVSVAMGSCISLVGAAGALAEITLEESNYSAGVLTIRGETSQPNARVTLDGRYSEWTNRYGGFTFRVRYLPDDCLAQIRSGQEERPAYITNCKPALPKISEPSNENGPDLATTERAGELRVVKQPCERGSDCMVVCRTGEYAVNAYCPRGSADILDERTVACRQDSPSQIVAYCISPGGS